MIVRNVLDLLLMLLTSISVNVAQDAKVPQYEAAAECFVEIPEDFPFAYDCGHVTVPEFHKQQSERTFSLGVIRVKSPSETPGAPVFFVAGGPGDDSTSSAISGTVLLQNLLANHDLVYYDQRGTLNSGLLSCHELFEAQVTALTQGLNADARQNGYNDAIQTCYDRNVADGVNFAAFNSLESAADINDIRKALGYEKIVLHGRSYGTLLAQHVIRDFPEILESVILDGSFGLAETDNWIGVNAVKEQFAFDYMFDLCNNDPACSAAVPNAKEKLTLLLEQLRDKPITTSIDVGEGPIQLVIDDVWASRAFDAMSQFSNTRQLLFGLLVVLNDESNPQYDQGVASLAQIIALTELSEPTAAFMMHFAVACSEDPVHSVQPMFAFDGLDLQSLTYGIQDAENYIFACELFDVPVLPDKARVNVPSDIPVLFLNGGYDNATPTYMNQKLAEEYDNRFSFTFANGHHVNTFDEDFYPCIGQVIEQFVTDPATEPDGSCVAEFGTELFPPDEPTQ